MADIGKLRRSSLVSTFGPGAIVDFRADGVPVSAVVAGLEEWDRNFPSPGIANEQSTTEPRLLQKLRLRGINVQGFRLPPVLPDREMENDHRRLIAVQFPTWLQCPRCSRIGQARSWPQRPGKALRYCQICSVGRDEHVIPVRFVIACTKGHLDDLPWHRLVQHRAECLNKGGFLKLEAKGAGLPGLVLSCEKCRASRTMEGIFGPETWKTLGHKCSGHRPWLAAADERNCDAVPRTLQRGAANLYFPVTESALDIPPWSDQLQAMLGQFWSPITAIEDTQQRAMFIQNLASTLQPVLTILGLNIKQLTAEVEHRLRSLEVVKNEDLRAAEYRQFVKGSNTKKKGGQQFETRAADVREELTPWIRQIVRAVRLREVRALLGFTRINPPNEEESTRAPLAVANPGWLPAIEVFGEGVFIDLARPKLEEWEMRPAVRERAQRLAVLWHQDYALRSEKPSTREISPRFLLIHTLAHALMRQLTLDCGYSNASLRERLYVGLNPSDMAGLLIYTATADADGTLGGLQRQGLPDRMARTIPAAIRAMEWCSSDPLCIGDAMAPPEAASGAACHACTLAPETSCEEFNRLLDRALLVGTPDQPELGFFRDFLGKS